MRNLFQQFNQIYLTDAAGVPQRLVLYLGANEIVLDTDPILFPLQLVTPPSISPTGSVQVGAVLTYQTPVYTGSGPIVLQTYVLVNGSAVDPLTGNPVDPDGTQGLLTGPGPFQYTTRSAQPTQFVTTARGADGITMPAVGAAVQVTVPAPPTFSRTPSLLPAVVAGGSPIAVDPGTGPGLTWTLTLSGVDVRSQVVNGFYTPPAAGGVIVLRSTISNAGGSVSQEASAVATATSTSPGPSPDPTYTMTQDGFTVQNAGVAEPGQINVTQDGFTVEPN